MHENFGIKVFLSTPAHSNAKMFSRPYRMRVDAQMECKLFVKVTMKIAKTRTTTTALLRLYVDVILTNQLG